MAKLQYHGEMAEVVSFCGIEVADTLSELLSGLTLYVPQTRKGVTEDHALAVLEDDMLDVLIRAFGGGRLYISKKRGPHLDFEVCESLLDAGFSVRQVSIKVGISERQIYRRIAEKKESARRSAAAERCDPLSQKSYPFVRVVRSINARPCAGMNKCWCRIGYAIDQGVTAQAAAHLLGMDQGDCERIGDVLTDNAMSEPLTKLPGDSLCAALRHIANHEPDPEGGEGGSLTDKLGIKT
ncbi:hypothetical protein AN189_12290 [Loktanella sp. 3ANDIMAR09]|uniref:hypothetical protein n=1 Tax=Loktanella sp. 3ANDIMAR09 TaxID=1225657 RepID=UPI0006F85692|nr:hypothetical protein [Loktanella sp. 3ANDIMAR09]KQI68166.1 hypothetical protein AN189_12290 [Loktanella sp. 3ANDIMAR09]